MYYLVGVSRRILRQLRSELTRQRETDADNGPVRGQGVEMDNNARNACPPQGVEWDRMGGLSKLHQALGKANEKPKRDRLHFQRDTRRADGLCEYDALQRVAQVEERPAPMCRVVVHAPVPNDPDEDAQCSEMESSHGGEAVACRTEPRTDGSTRVHPGDEPPGSEVDLEC